MRRVIAFALALSLCIPAIAQGAAPWDGDILPPAPAWRGKSERLVVRPNDPWITPSEVSGLTTTPSYVETRAFLERMDAASPLIRMEAFGRSPQGRDLLAVFVSKDGATFLFGVVGNFWGTRGKHPGWILLGVAVLLIGFANSAAFQGG